jgi:plasmid replication initiation protein
MQILPVEAEYFHANGWTDVTKLALLNTVLLFDGKVYSTLDLSKQILMNSIKMKPTYVFRNFAKALKNLFPRTMTPFLIHRTKQMSKADNTYIV